MIAINMFDFVVTLTQCLFNSVVTFEYIEDEDRRRNALKFGAVGFKNTNLGHSWGDEWLLEHMGGTETKVRWEDLKEAMELMVQLCPFAYSDAVEVGVDERGLILSVVGAGTRIVPACPAGTTETKVESAGETAAHEARRRWASE